MNKIFVTGDTHGSHSIRKLSSDKFEEGKALTKEDFVIIAGDFGLVWSHFGGSQYKEEQYWLKWLHERPWTTLFVDGNHENHEILERLEQVEKFGSTVGKVNDSVFHLKRGQVYAIGDKKIATMGGAYSIDKEYRTNRISWWQEELPNCSELNTWIENLSNVKNSVDYIITHDCPSSIMGQINSHHFVSESPSSSSFRLYLEIIKNKTNFSAWIFGHHHQDVQIEEKFFCVYNKILEL